MDTRKRFALLPATGLLALFILAGCDKLPENGNLDGMWQMTEIHYCSQTGQYDSIVFKKKEQVYWLFQFDVMAIRTRPDETQELSDTIRARFHYTKNRLDITEIYHHLWSVKDSLITDEHTTDYAAYGILGNKAAFTIEKLDGKAMRLRSDYAEISFRKF